MSDCILRWVRCFLLCCCASWAHASDEYRSMFWQLEKGNVTLSLLGSIHMGHRDMYPLPDHVMQAFNQASTLVVEVDLDPSKPEIKQTAKTFAMKGGYPAGESLLQHIFDEDRKNFDALIRRFGLPMHMVAQQRPWLVSVMFTVEGLKRAGFDEKRGIDHYFLAQARGKKTIQELETADMQMQLLTSMPDEVQLGLLRETLRLLTQQPNYFRYMLDTWMKGDAPALDKLMQGGFGRDKAGKYGQKVLLTDRNNAMTKKIEAMSQTGGHYFVVVGAGHFVGDDGILAQLLHNGFKLK